MATKQRPRTADDKRASRKVPLVTYDMNGRPQTASANMRPTTTPTDPAAATAADSTSHEVRSRPKSAPLGTFLGLEPGPNGDFTVGLGMVALSPVASHQIVQWSPLARDPLTGKRGTPGGGTQRRPPKGPGTVDLSSIDLFRRKSERPDPGPLDRPGVAQRPGWDGNHHVAFSRHNEALPKSLREYFPQKLRVPMATQTQHRESFAPFGHVEGRSGLFQEAAPVDPSRMPKFSHEVWRTADPFFEPTEAPEIAVTAPVCRVSTPGQGARPFSPLPADPYATALVAGPGLKCGKKKLASRHGPGLAATRHAKKHGSMAHPHTGQARPWNDRCAEAVSKHNEKLHASQREFFFVETSASLRAPPSFLVGFAATNFEHAVIFFLNSVTFPHAPCCCQVNKKWREVGSASQERV